MASTVSRSGVLLFMLAVMFGSFALRAQNAAVVLEREGTTVALEPYAPNILRVTMSMLKDQAIAGPGYGIVAKPVDAGWAHETTASGDTYRSARMTLFLAAPAPPQKRPDGSFWRGPKKNYNGVGREPYLTITASDGKPLLKMQGWEMAELNDKDGDSQLNNDRRSQDPQFYRVGATFASPDDEHYYGLGQNQEGYLDHRQHKV